MHIISQVAMDHVVVPISFNLFMTYATVKMHGNNLDDHGGEQEIKA